MILQDKTAIEEPKKRSLRMCCLGESHKAGVLQYRAPTGVVVAVPFGVELTSFRNIETRVHETRESEGWFLGSASLHRAQATAREATRTGYFFDYPPF